MVHVEVVYSIKEGDLTHLQLEVEPGSTIAAVMQKVGILEDASQAFTGTVGIFSKITSLDRIVKEGDRIELYRPLLIDPKDKRRQRHLQHK